MARDRNDRPLLAACARLLAANAEILPKPVAMARVLHRELDAQLTLHGPRLRDVFETSGLRHDPAETRRRALQALKPVLASASNEATTYADFRAAVIEHSIGLLEYGGPNADVPTKTARGIAYTALRSLTGAFEDNGAIHHHMLRCEAAIGYLPDKR